MPGSAASCGGHSMLPPAPRALEERPGIVTGEGVKGQVREGTCYLPPGWGSWPCRTPLP